MKFRQRYKNKSLHTIIAIIFCISILLFGESIVYSALNSTMRITGSAIVRVDEDTRITGISLDNVSNDGLELYSPEYSKNTIKTGIRLDKLDSTVNYRVNITNSGNVDMTINNIIAQVNNNPNIIFEYDYELESKIGLGVTTINFTFKYSDNVLKDSVISQSIKVDDKIIKYDNVAIIRGNSRLFIIIYFLLFG